MKPAPPRAVAAPHRCGGARAGVGCSTRLRVALIAAAASLAVALVDAPGSHAQDARPGFLTPAIETPSVPRSTPEGFVIGSEEAIALANRERIVTDAREDLGRLVAVPEAKGRSWEVRYVAGEAKVALVIVDGVSGSTRAWTGSAVDWPMARGREGQFGHVLNSPFVWIPLSGIFLLGLVDLRRMRRIVHLDLIVLLSFGISHIFFNAAEIGTSVPLVYPPLVYLLARMLWIGFRGAGSGLRPSAPVAALAFATVALVCFRIAINVGDSGVIDVGYAGVIGADRIASGEPIYGEFAFPFEIRTGDTYGPANYYAYVPFELIFGWSGAWDSLPAARAAAIVFDVAAIAGMFFLGRMLGGPRRGMRLGVTLAFAWAAYPYTAFTLQSNSNDALVGALVIWALVALASPPGRAGLLAVASAVKFAPLALVPLFAAGERGLADRVPRLRERSEGPPSARRRALAGLRPVGYFAAVFVGAAILLFLHPAVDPGLATFWDRTVANQIGRESPFSIWGQVGWLGPLQTTVGLAAAALSGLLAFFPRLRAPAQIAALGAATLIAAQLAIDHWFYLYIPWFFGLLMAALVVSRGVDRGATKAAPKRLQRAVGEHESLTTKPS